MKRCAILLILAVFFMLLGCASDKTTPITLKEKFPKLETANKINITNGSTGGNKVIVDQAAIDQWIEQVKDIVLYPDTDQGERDGFLFVMSLYKDEEKLASLSLGFIDDIYYIVDEVMWMSTKELYGGD